MTLNDRVDEYLLDDDAFSLGYQRAINEVRVDLLDLLDSTSVASKLEDYLFGGHNDYR